jgi:hypothetical protein
MSAVGIALLLFLALKSRRGVMLNLPFALVGGVLSVLLTGATLSLGGMVGFVTLFGIALRNSIMLISHFEYLVHVEGVPWGIDAAVRGASRAADPDSGDRARAVAAGAHEWRGRQRDRGAHGDRHSRRARHLDTTESDRVADTRAALRVPGTSRTGNAGRFERDTLADVEATSSIARKSDWLNASSVFIAVRPLIKFVRPAASPGVPACRRKIAVAATSSLRSRPVKVCA